MIVDVTHPEFHLAVPGQSRTPKAVWMRRQAAIDIPNHQSSELTLAVKYKHASQKYVTEIFRIGTQYFRIAEFSPGFGAAARTGTAAETASSALCHGAWSWFKKNVSIDTPRYPEINYDATSLVIHLRDLPVFGNLKLSKQDDDLRRDFEDHMEMVRAGLVTIDGYLFVPCQEPVYAVTGYGSATLIEVCVTERLPNSAIAAFPIGKYAEAVDFAKAVTQGRDLRYGEAIGDVTDCGEAIHDDTEIRSLRNAASLAASRFESVYAGPYAASYQAATLLQTVPLEDIALYRRLKELSEVAEYTEEYADNLFPALEEARTSRYSASVFTDSNQFPLAEVLSLWENRPITLPGHARGVGPR